MALDITTVLSSTVFAGLIAGFVSLRKTERKIAIENITKQREVWRDKIRTKSLEVTRAFHAKDSSKLLELYNEFLLLLNPFDPEDKAIIDVLWDLKLCMEKTSKLIAFTERLSLLLKHDWERAKREAKPWFFRGCQTKREAYASFQNKKNDI